METVHKCSEPLGRAADKWAAPAGYTFQQHFTQRCAAQAEIRSGFVPTHNPDFGRYNREYF